MMEWISLQLDSYPYQILAGLAVLLVLLAFVTFFQVSRGIRYSKTKRALLSKLEKLSGERS